MIEGQLNVLDQLSKLNGRDRRKAMSSGEVDSSEDSAPDPLMRELPPAAPFPIENLGPSLGGAAHKLVETIQAPDSLCVQGVLASASLAVQAHRNVVIDGRSYPLSQFFFAIGESGERKTAVERETLRKHRDRQAQLANEYVSQTRDFKIRMETFERLRGEKLRDAKSPDQAKALVEDIGNEPDEPLQPILLMTEPSLEGIHKILERGQPSIGLFSSEGGRMLGGYSMKDEHQLKTSAGLSELWDAEDISRTRAGDGAITLRGRRFSLSLMVQPLVAPRLIGNQLLVSQGLPSRCLVAWPASTAGSRFYQSVDLSQDPALGSYHDRIGAIMDEPTPLAEGKRNELEPRSLHLDPGAKALWIRFHDSVERQLRDGGPFAPIRGFANKAAEHVLRMAGVLTCFEDLHASAIKATELAAATEVIQFYLGEALRIFHSTAADPDLMLAQKLLGWAREHGVIYSALVYQRGPNAIRDKRTAKKIIEILESHRWLQRIAGGTEVDGTWRKDAWRVWSDESVPKV